MSAGFGGRRRTAAIRARMTPRPFGFLLLSVPALCCALACIGAVMDSGVAAPFRATYSLVAVTSLLAAEALWRVRPWAFRATAAMLLSLAVTWVTMFIESGGGWEGFFVGVLSLVPVAGLAAPVLIYVHRRSVRLSGTGKVAAAPRAPAGGMP